MPFESSWDRVFNYLIKMSIILSICTLRVCWNWSSTASLEGRILYEDTFIQIRDQFLRSSKPFKSLRIQLSYDASVRIRGCAGIGRQLHPLKAEYMIKDLIDRRDSPKVWTHSLSLQSRTGLKPYQEQFHLESNNNREPDEVFMEGDMI